MNIGRQIKDMAAEMAAHSQQRASNLQRELAETEDRKAQLEAQLHAANLAHKRLAEFQVKIGTDYQCPRCWIDHETRAALTPIGGGTDKEDFFRCHTCNLTVSVMF